MASKYHRASEFVCHGACYSCRIEKNGVIYHCLAYDSELDCLRELAIYQKLSPLGLCPSLIGTIKLNGKAGIITELFDGGLNKLIRTMEPNVDQLKLYLEQVYQMHQALLHTFNGSHGCLCPGWILYKRNPDESIRFALITFQSVNTNTTEESKYADLLRFENYFENSSKEANPAEWHLINYRFSIPEAIRLQYEKERQEYDYYSDDDYSDDD